MQTNAENKLFISHSTTDVVLVNAFVRFLKEGLGISKDSIFCTSLSGTLETGYSFISQIQNSLIECKKVFFLITENYLKSPFCMAELGAAWATNQNIYPLIMPPVSVADYNRTPLLGIQANDISRENALAVLNDELVKDGIINRVSTPQFMEADREFKSTLQKLLCGIQADAEGWIVATVDTFKELTNGGIPYQSYKIKEKIYMGNPLSENEVHWVLLKGQSSFHLTPNEKLKFRMKDILSNERYDDNRYIVVSSLWIAHAEL